MIIWFKGGQSMGMRIDPLTLYDIYKEAERKIITVFIHFPVKAGPKMNVLDIDAERTFASVVKCNFPSAPPDTEREYMLDSDCGDDGDCHKSKPPRSSTLPCEEK